ncbi:MAG: DUF4034 domain-containing protein [Proteobacteria bacterium]|nr:DUF4034 domain-containing protein [Pseudomonadota bacterium]
MKNNLVIIAIIVIVAFYLFPFQKTEKRETFLPLNLPNEVIANDVGKWYEKANIRGEVQQAVDENNFDKLETMVHKARSEKLKFNDMGSALLYLYNMIPGLTDSYESLYELVDEWRRHSPQSNIPDIIEARAFKVTAWDIRGDVMADKVSKNRHDDFKIHLSRAWDSITIAAKKGPIDSVVCSVQTELAFVLFEDKKLAKEHFYKCAKIEPGYMPLYYIMRTHLQEKWSGSDKELLQFVEESADATKHIYGDGLYSLLAYSHTRDTNKVFIESGGLFSWNRTRRGFRDILEKYGKSSYILHGYGYLAMSVSDHEAFAEVLQETGTEWNPLKERYYRNQSVYNDHLSKAKVYMIP